MNNELQVKTMLVHHDSVYQTRSTGLSFYCFAHKILELIPCFDAFKNPFEEETLDTFALEITTNFYGYPTERRKKKNCF